MFAGEDRFFPFVVVRLRGVPDAGDVAAMRAFYAPLHARQLPYIHLVDGRTGKRPDSTVRQLIAEFTKETLDHTTKYQRALAVVLDNALASGVMTALRWAVPSTTPEKYFPGVAPAMAWLEQEARRSGVAIGEDARAYVKRLESDLNVS